MIVIKKFGLLFLSLGVLSTSLLGDEIKKKRVIVKCKTDVDRVVVGDDEKLLKSFSCKKGEKKKFDVETKYHSITVSYERQTENKDFVKRSVISRDGDFVKVSIEEYELDLKKGRFEPTVEALNKFETTITEHEKTKDDYEKAIYIDKNINLLISHTFVYANFTDAIETCEDYMIGGIEGWRLPNLKDIEKLGSQSYISNSMMSLKEGFERYSRFYVNVLGYKFDAYGDKTRLLSSYPQGSWTSASIDDKKAYFTYDKELLTKLKRKTASVICVKDI